MGRLRIDQVGLPAGTPGKSRTDGLDNGAVVTLTNVDADGLTQFRLLWGPPEDTTAQASLAPTGGPDVWTFTPTASAYGAYIVELLEDGLSVEARIFGVRLPVSGLLIPGLNERASKTASWINDGDDQRELSQNNATDFGVAVLDALNYAGWWRSQDQLYRVVEALAAGGGSAGQRGRPGPPGPEGERGEPGEQGPPGPRGRQGAQGPAGAAGSDGAAGATGATGDTGPTGATGATGARGRAGVGLEGERGEPGEQGPPGPRGRQGIQGAAGSAGAAGATGATGARGRAGVGLEGERGEPGEQGPPGPRGRQGAQGPAGATGPALGAVIDVSWTGTQHDVDVIALGLTNGGVLRVALTGAATVTGFLASGISGEFEFTLECISPSNSGITFKDANVGSSLGSRIRLPAPPAGAVPDLLIYNSSGIKFRLLSEPSPSTSKAWYATAVAQRLLIAPSDLASEATTHAVPFVIRTPLVAGTPGTADDVTVTAPAFGWRILDCWLIVSTAIGGSTVQLRNVAGGGGGARSSALSSAATGTVRNNDTTTFTFVAGGNLFARRSDRGVAGELIILGIRT